MWTPFLPKKVKENLKDKPFRRMYCPDCKKPTKAAAWWTPDEGMLDWYCPDCERPIETVVMRTNKTLVDYLVEMWREEFPVA